MKCSNFENLYYAPFSDLDFEHPDRFFHTRYGPYDMIMIWSIIWTPYHMDPMFEFWFFKETNLYLYWSCSYILYHWSETNYKEKPIPGRKTLRLVKAWNACNMHPAWRILVFESQEPSDRFVPALHDLGMTSLWPLIGQFQFSRYHKSWFNFLDTRRDDFDGRTGLLTTSKKIHII